MAKEYVYKIVVDGSHDYRFDVGKHLRSNLIRVSEANLMKRYDTCVLAMRRAGAMAHAFLVEQTETGGSSSGIMVGKPKNRSSAFMGSFPIIARYAGMKYPPIDNGVFLAGWDSVDVQGGSIVHNTARHADFVEYGTRANRKWPPKPPIEQWVRRKNLHLNLTEIRGKKNKDKVMKAGKTFYNLHEFTSRSTPLTPEQEVALITRFIRRAIGKRGNKAARIIGRNVHMLDSFGVDMMVAALDEFDKSRRTVVVNEKKVNKHGTKVTGQDLHGKPYTTTSISRTVVYQGGGLDVRTDIGGNVRSVTQMDYMARSGTPYTIGGARINRYDGGRGLAELPVSRTGD